MRRQFITDNWVFKILKNNYGKLQMKVTRWSVSPEKGQMTLSVKKCEAMHIGRNNLKNFYFAYIEKGSELTVSIPK